MQNFKKWLELNETIDDTKKSSLEELLDQIKVDYPFAKVDAYENDNRIELMKIQIPHDQRNTGIGSSIIRSIQKYAASVGKPIVIRPAPEPGKKAALDRFYKNLDFVHNKGRNIDYTLSSPVSKTMYWRNEAVSYSPYINMSKVTEYLPSMEEYRVSKDGIPDVKKYY